MGSKTAERSSPGCTVTGWYDSIMRVVAGRGEGTAWVACLAASLLIAMAALAGGCTHPQASPESATTAENEVSHALIGKQITVRGKFSLRGVVGPYVLLENQQVVYLVASGSFTWGEPYSEMEGKLVVATGILRFSRQPEAAPTDRSIARPPDYFYFEAETAQLRLASD